MRFRFTLTLAAALCTAAALGDEFQSGVEVGGGIGSYSTTKVAGCDDGVKDGQTLCYTWKLGGRPVVFIFAKTPGDSLASLAKQIDKLVEANAEKKLFAVINFTGEPNDPYLEAIKKFGEQHALKHIALTISSDGERFKVSPEAEVTVMHYKEKKVAFNLASKEGLDEAATKAAVEAVSKILE